MAAQSSSFTLTEYEIGLELGKLDRPSQRLIKALSKKILSTPNSAFAWCQAIESCMYKATTLEECKRYLYLIDSVAFCHNFRPFRDHYHLKQIDRLFNLLLFKEPQDSPTKAELLELQQQWKQAAVNEIAGLLEQLAPFVRRTSQITAMSSSPPLSSSANKCVINVVRSKDKTYIPHCDICRKPLPREFEESEQSWWFPDSCVVYNLLTKKNDVLRHNACHADEIADEN